MNAARQSAAAPLGRAISRGLQEGFEVYALDRPFESQSTVQGRDSVAPSDPGSILGQRSGHDTQKGCILDILALHSDMTWSKLAGFERLSWRRLES